MSISQDKKGYIWIGTQFNGVQRFDGIRFQDYRKDFLEEGSAIIQSARISLIDNEIWVHSQKLFRYKPYGNRFIAIKPGFFKEKNYKYIMFTDENNKQWYVDNYGIYSYDTDTRKMHHELVFLNSVINGNEILVYDPIHQQYWAFFNDSLSLFDVRSKKKLAIEKTHAALFNFLKKNNLVAEIRFMLIDSYHNLWISTYRGQLIKYNLLTEKIAEYSRSKIEGTLDAAGNQPGYLEVEYIFEDDHQNLWFATRGSGLLKYDKQADKFDYLVAEKNDPKGIKYNYEVFTIFQDKKENLWIGTDKGISIFNPYRDYFRTISNDKNNSGLPPDEINAVLQTKDNQLWVGTWGGGIAVFDSTFQLKKNYAFKDAGRNMTWCLIEDNQGKIWSGCQHGLINHYDPTTGKFDTTYKIGTNKSTIRCMAKDHRGNIYFGLHNGKIAKWDADKDLFYEYNYGTPVNLKTNPIAGIFIDSHQNIWANTWNGFFRFDGKQMIFVDSFFADKNRKSSIAYNRITAIQQLNDSTLMMGYMNGGGCYFNINTKVFTKWNLEENLQTKTIQATKEDKNQTIWFTTDYGLHSFVPGKENNATNYYIDKEIINSPFFMDKLIDLHNGEWAAATSTEVIKFNPEKLIGGIDNELPVEITGFKISGKEKLIDSFLENYLPVRLRYSENFLTVEFATLDFSFIQNRKYFYKLSGIDKQWVPADNNLSANYTDLEPGTYIFSVKSESVNKKGGITSFKIIISPPFWKSWLFIALYTITAVSIVYLLIRKRIKTIRHESGLKQKILETEMAALRAQMNPHFIFNCINAIDSLIQNNEKDRATAYLARFAKLIRNVLESSKNNVIPFYKDLEAIRLYIDLEQFRCSNKFHYTIYADEELLNGDYTVPPLLIQPFIENAIHHGLLNKKHADKQLFIDIRLEGEIIVYNITDNGVGRKRSGQLNTINKPEHISYGIQISKERLEIYNRSIHQPQRKRIINGDEILITDLFDNDIPSGTRVEVKLKAV